MLSEEQKRNRLSGIYGTDCGIICGLNPYKNKIELWKEKTGLAVEPDISDNPSVKAGNYLEPVLRQWFSDETGLTVEIKEEELQHHEHSWMRGHVDGIITQEDGTQAILELKTASIRQKDKWGEFNPMDANANQFGFINSIPEHYLMQVTHYLCVANLSVAYVAVLIGGNDFRIYVVERNEVLEKIIIELEKAFWDCVQSSECPDPETLPELESLLGMHPINENPIEADIQTMQNIESYRLITQQIGELKDKADSLKEEICLYMGMHDVLTINGVPAVTWKERKGATRVNSALLKREYPDIFEKVTNVCANTRTFLFKATNQ